MNVSTRAETVVSRSPAETAEAAARTAARLAPGDVVLLRGEVGSGKSVFVRAAAHALGVEGPVTSPTYAIGNLHDGSDCEIAHLDLYRLDQLAVADATVLEDFLTPQRIAFVEWPHEELSDLPGLRLLVDFEHAGGDERRIEISWLDDER